MRTTCRLILGIAVFIAAAGVAFAQQPDPQPPLPPLPQAQVTPAPAPPDIVPPAEQTSATPALPAIPTDSDMVVSRPARSVNKASTSPAKKPARAMAGKRPIDKPTTAEGSPQAREAIAAGSVTATDSTSPPPPGALKPDLSPKAPLAVDPAVQAEMDKKLADATQRKRSLSNTILLGVAVLALMGLAFFFVRSRTGVDTVPPIFESGLQQLPIAAGDGPVERTGPRPGPMRPRP